MVMTTAVEEVVSSVSQEALLPAGLLTY